MIPSLLELALRALLVAVAVRGGLRLFGVRNVLAQKTAWGLVLAAAMFMPAWLPLAARFQMVPAGATVAIPAQPWRVVAEAVRAAIPARETARRATGTAPSRTERAVASAPAVHSSAVPSLTAAPIGSTGASSFHSTIEIAPPMVRVHEAPVRRPLLPSLAALGLSIYLGVCGVLLVRLLLGLTSAISLWSDGEPVDAALASGLRVRSSRAICSPVTIGSGVVLPADYAEWDEEKLRIVLAHERSHIRQGDFYLQLLAGIYSALFWFSPLGWWLKSKLSDLAEAISDRAGLEAAQSRSAYAQILLEFAAAPRTAVVGVAMARSNSLSHRIDRLLNDSSFRQAFSGGRQRALVAVLLVPVALFAATAMIRVQAAQDAPASATPAPITAPITGVSQTEAIESIAPVARVAPVAPVAPPEPVTAPTTVIPEGAPLTPPPPMLPVPPIADQENVTIGAGQSVTITNRNRDRHRSYSHSGSGDGYAYSFSSDGESYALVTQPGGRVRFNGDYHTSEIDKAERVAKGKFLWFTHDGKSYVVDDPAIVDQISAMYAPIDELGRKQEELGKQQEALGRQQEELGRKQEQASVPAPDISREIAKIEEAIAKLKAKQGANVTQDDLSDLQGKLGDLQGKLGDVEGRIGEEQGKLGEQQGELGERQGKLGEEQGRLGEEQGKLAEEADRKVKSIIDESLHNGKARPVE